MSDKYERNKKIARARHDLALCSRPTISVTAVFGRESVFPNISEKYLQGVVIHYAAAL